MMDFSKLILVLVWKSILSSYSECSNLYGRRCPFVPAPSGKTPSCARPGFTFCENPDGYPGQLIMFLASQARYNHRSLVTDETKDEFSETRGPYPPSKYPSSVGEIHLTTSAPMHPHPQFANYTGSFLDGFNGHQDVSVSQNRGQFLKYKYTSNIPYSYEDSSSLPGFPAYANYLWKRDLSTLKPMHERLKRRELFHRHLMEIRESPFKKKSTEIKYKRNKRQSEDVDGSGRLCQTRSSFLMPRAAINKDGDWMYIVNMENSDQKYTQLVRSEVCTSETCSSICGLPIGYTSKCEQKYIQKRLIALKGQGDQLYTDIFWIPSCCVCTITRN